jgi:cytochrome c oxidase subunit 2
MPTYQGQVSEEGVIALVEYIKNLNSNYRIEQTLNTTDLLPEGEVKSAPVATGAAGKKAAPPTTEPQGMVKQ